MSRLLKILGFSRPEPLVLDAYFLRQVRRNWFCGTCDRLVDLDRNLRCEICGGDIVGPA